MTDINDIASAFKFEPGAHEYIVEIKADSGLSMDDVTRLQMDYLRHNIHIAFLFTAGEGFKINAIPVMVEEKQA